MYVCESYHSACMGARGQFAGFSWLSSSIMCILRLELRSSDLAAIAYMRWALSLLDRHIFGWLWTLGRFVSAVHWGPRWRQCLYVILGFVNGKKAWRNSKTWRESQEWVCLGTWTEMVTGILEVEWCTVVDRGGHFQGLARQILTWHLSEFHLPPLLWGDCCTEIKPVSFNTCSEAFVSGYCFVLLMVVCKFIVILVFIIIRDWGLSINCATGTAFLVEESVESCDPQVDAVAW